VPTETPVKPLFPWLTVRRNVEIGLELKARKRSWLTSRARAEPMS
jgi:ABC-type nitrate/sulfonate/bicarbonate transport system ATPase subunit